MFRPWGPETRLPLQPRLTHSGSGFQAQSFSRFYTWTRPRALGRRRAQQVPRSGDSANPLSGKGRASPKTVQLQRGPMGLGCRPSHEATLLLWLQTARRRPGAAGPPLASVFSAELVTRWPRFVAEGRGRSSEARS